LTGAEKLMWSKLRDRRLEGVKFKRQKPIGRYERSAADAARTRALEESGYHVVRFWNNDVLGNIDGVLEALVQELNISR
jgi:very-short-patch-repair endonuclease